PRRADQSETSALATMLSTTPLLLSFGTAVTNHQWTLSRPSSNIPTPSSSRKKLCFQSVRNFSNELQANPFIYRIYADFPAKPFIYRIYAKHRGGGCVPPLHNRLSPNGINDTSMPLSLTT